jgi:iduronate 2-sulfatase
VKSLAGQSLRPMLEDPAASGREFAYSFHGRGQLMGRTLRTDRYRFVQWRHRKTGEVAQVELYDHQDDPAESKNVAGEHPELVERLSAELDDRSYEILRGPKGA